MQVSNILAAALARQEVERAERIAEMRARRQRENARRTRAYASARPQAGDEPDGDRVLTQDLGQKYDLLV